MLYKQKGKLKEAHMLSLPPTPLLWKYAVHWDDFYSDFLTKMSSSESEVEGFYSDEDSFTISDHQTDFSDNDNENEPPNSHMNWRDPER